MNTSAPSKASANVVEAETVPLANSCFFHPNYHGLDESNPLNRT
jgi:hypothetical protein